MAGHSLLLELDTDSPEFVRGFEAGRVWARLRAEPGEEIVETVHAANAEMLLRLAEATNRRVSAEDLGEEWVEATFAPAEALESP